MAEKVIYKLKGHEKFALREGWVNKGIKASIEHTPHIFLESKGADVLGVGTNMVKSIRYWMQACKLLIKDGNNEKISDLSKVIFEKDPYLEDIFSIWLLHSNLVKNRDVATVWYMFFNSFKADEFSRSDLFKQMKQELFKFVGKQVTESSVEGDIDVLLNMYSKGELKNDDPEDKNICPLASLGLIKKEDEIFVKKQPDLRKVSDTLILYELSIMFDHEKSLSIETIATGERSLGAIYHLSRVSINRYLDSLETKGFIRVDRTAGLDVVYPVKLGNPIEIINGYYK